jgi:hypothetical protein
MHTIGKVAALADVSPDTLRCDCPILAALENSLHEVSR